MAKEKKMKLGKREVGILMDAVTRRRLGIYSNLPIHGLALYRAALKLEARGLGCVHRAVLSNGTPTQTVRGDFEINVGGMKLGRELIFGPLLSRE